VLRRSLEIPIDDVRSVDYRNGRLVITTEDDDRVFDHVEVNDTDVMESFSRRDAEDSSAGSGR
jgi:coenzyme F420-reducing hydrogenase beta subunit